MRKIFRISLMVATSAVIVFVIAESITASHIAHAQATFPAYTVTTENRIVSGPHAGSTLPYVRTVARRSDGARVEIGPIFGQPGILAGDRVRTIVLADGEDFSVYDHLRVKTTYASDAWRKERKSLALVKAPPGCVRTTEHSLPGEAIMGQDTVRAVSNRAMDGKPIVVTHWLALNLNCETLRGTIEEKLPDGSLTLHNDISLKSLVLGDPDPALFIVPADYTEVKPSEYMRREAAKLQLPIDARFEKEAQKLDESYARNH